MTNRARYLAALTLFVSLGTAGPAMALSNVSFETGFGTWVAFGDVLIDNTSTYGASATDGTAQLLMTTLPNNAGDDQGAPLGGTGALSGTDAIGAAALEAGLGLGAGVLDGLSPSTNPAFQGSGIYQDFTTVVSTTLSFDWNFITNEAIPTVNYTDFVFWVLTPAGGGPVIASGSLDDTNASTFTPSSAALFNNQTGYQSTFSYDINAPGSYRISIGVVDVLDDNYTSAALVDNFSLVPEPSTALLVGMGLVFMSARRRAR